MSAVTASAQAQLQGLAAAIRAELVDTIAAKAAALADQARGLAPGALGASLTIEPDGLSAEVGSDLPYARLFELGFQGSESVKASLRTIRQVYGRPVAPHQIAVTAYSRSVDRPAQPFLAPALDPEALLDDIAAAIDRVLGS